MRAPRGLLAGALLGILAVVASGLLVPRGSPPAYGLCVACHGRDLLAGLGLSRWVGTAALDGVVLTTAGILLGAAAAARLSREWRYRKARHPVRSLLLGMATMASALLALGCTTRLALRVAYGDPLALWSMLGVGLAISGVTAAMVWAARRPSQGGESI